MNILTWIEFIEPNELASIAFRDRGMKDNDQAKMKDKMDRGYLFAMISPKAGMPRSRNSYLSDQNHRIITVIYTNPFGKVKRRVVTMAFLRLIRTLLIRLSFRE